MSPARKLTNLPLFQGQKGQGIIEIVVVLGLAAILILSLVALSVRSNRSANFSKAEDQAARLSQEGMEAIENIKSQENVEPVPQAFNLQFPVQWATNCGANPGDWGIAISWNEFYDRDMWDQQCNQGDYPGSGVGFWGGIEAQYGRVGWFHLAALGAPDPACGDAGENWCMHFAQDAHFSPDPSRVVVDGRTFHRIVYVADTPTNYCVGSRCGKSRCNEDDPASLEYRNDYDDIKQFTVQVFWDDTSGRHESITTKCITR